MDTGVMFDKENSGKAVILCCVLAAGCAGQAHKEEHAAGQQQLKWYHYPPVSQAAFDAEVLDCKNQSFRPAPVQPGQVIDTAVFNACMRSKGWVLK
jgi:hypothetical protein